MDRNNKFYMGQLIQDRDQFVVFRRWGRVGDQKANVSDAHIGLCLALLRALTDDYGGDGRCL